MIADSLRADGRFALRALRRAPLFTVLTVLALALGLGANSAIFAVVRGVLLRPLPYADPDRLVMIWSDNRREHEPQNPISPANFARPARRGPASFERMEGLSSFLLPQRRRRPVAASRWRRPRSSRLACSSCSARSRSLGRTFADGETRGVVVLSHGYWLRRFGGDPQIVGKVIPLVDQVMAMNAGTPLQGAVVIGVMPPDFVFPYRSMLGPSGFTRAHDVDMWLPLPSRARVSSMPSGASRRTIHLLAAVGPLEARVSDRRLRTADLAAVARRLEQAWPATNTGWGASAVSLLEQTVGTVRPALLLLLAGVSFVLVMTASTSPTCCSPTVSPDGVRWRCGWRSAPAGGGLVQQALVESVLLGLLWRRDGAARRAAGASRRWWRWRPPICRGCTR